MSYSIVYSSIPTMHRNHAKYGIKNSSQNGIMSSSAQCIG